MQTQPGSDLIMTSNPARNRPDNDLDNKAIQDCRGWSKQRSTLVPKLVSLLSPLSHSCVGAGLF